MASRVSKHITNKNDIEELIAIKEEDVTLSLTMELFGEFNEKARFRPYDTFTVPEDSYGSGNNEFTTTVGLWVFNKFCIEKDFCDILGYINHQIDGDEWEDIITKISRYVMEDKIDTDCLANLLQKAQKLMPISTPFSPSVSEKILLVSKYIEPKKMELAKKYAKELEAGDAVTAEKMKKELLDYALKWLGDDPALDIYYSKARSNFGNHFCNMNIMKGAIRNPDPTAEKQFNIALSCYNNGISREEYSLFCNSLAAGPYSRSKKTAIGGYWEKLITSAYQDDILDPPGSDCGTTDYLELTLNKKEINDWFYSYVLDPKTNQLVEINSDNYTQFVDKPIKLRFSGLCESKTGFCNKCMGNLFYRLGVKNIGLIMMMIGSRIKNINMKAFHDSTATTIRFNPVEAFGE